MSNVREGLQAGGKGRRPPTTTNRGVRSKPRHDMYMHSYKKTIFSQTVALLSQDTCIHVNTHENTYWWSGTNYEPV